MIDPDDEYGKRILEPLRRVPPMDPGINAQIKKNYLQKGESLRNDLIRRSSISKEQRTPAILNVFGIKAASPWVKIFAGALLALIVLVGSSFTVLAAQQSLPGEPLYAIKSLGEDIRIYITTSPQAKLELTLKYTNRRIEEIKTLLKEGRGLPEGVSERINGELENALWLAAQLDDTQMQNALGNINQIAKSQGTTLDELIDKLPEQAEPAIVQLQERLHEQESLSDKGKDNPKAFRDEMRERHQRYLEARKSKVNKSATPKPEKPDNKKDNDQPSNPNGPDDKDPGEGKPNPGNKTHIPENQKTP